MNGDQNVAEHAFAEHAGTSVRVAVVVGLVALGICACGMIADPQQFMAAYLTSYLFFLSFPLGAMVLVMIYHLTGGAWGFVVRPALEAMVRTLPFWAIGFLPIAVGVSYLYLGARPEIVAAEAELQKKTFYLTVPLFYGRMAGFFALWIVLAALLSGWSRKLGHTGETKYAKRLVTISGPGLLAYGITIHFAAVDWVMSLQPEFHSSIFGPLFVSGQVLSAFGLAAFVVCSPFRPRSWDAWQSSRALN
ncbi:MAG TPA: hypothetical protein VG713_13520, partial [Pirellulales bacterium]|nr:hypothetical protein [Pirellulales bacterium]